MKKNKFLIIICIVIIICTCVFFLFFKDIKEEKIQNYECRFTRTYTILAIYDDDDEKYQNITIKRFQANEISTVRILKKFKFEEKRSYEITFDLKKRLNDDMIYLIFDNSNIISVKDSDKLGLEQVNEKLCD